MIQPVNALLPILQQVPLFQPVAREHLQAFLSSGEGLLQRPFDAGEVIFSAGQFANETYMLLEGQLSLRCLRRGETQGAEVRRVQPYELFGEEPLTTAGRRTLTAVADSSVTVLAMSRVSIKRLFRVEALKAHLEQEVERLRRAALAERLGQTPLFSPLSRLELERLVPQVQLKQLSRGATVFKESDPATHVYLITEGSVTLGRSVNGMQHIRAWLVEGDFFGDLELLLAPERSVTAPERSVTATAQSALELIEVPAQTFLALRQTYPNLGDAHRRVTAEKNILIKGLGTSLPDLLGKADRLGVAQSLLLIDLNTCVRCGNCAWSCEQTHGRSRLVRRGETLKHRLPASETLTTSLLPSSCHHCTDAACMAGCPTGAIARELHGEVFVKEETCIGCGDCSKRCAWGNISIAPIPPEQALQLPGGGVQKARAVKCDNCRLFAVSACVHNCPTGAMRRVHPATYFPELAAMAGTPLSARGAGALREWLGRFLLLLLGLGLPGVAVVYGVQMPSPLRGGSSFGILTGVGALSLLGITLLYSARKRLIARVMRLNPRPPTEGTGMAKTERPLTVDLHDWLPAHMLLPLGACLLAGVHSGLHADTLQGLLLLTFFFCVMLTGALGAALYRLGPRLLTAIEDGPALLEDLDEQETTLSASLDEVVLGQETRFRPLRQQLERRAGAPRLVWLTLKRRLSRAQLVRWVQDEASAWLRTLPQDDQPSAGALLELLVHRQHLRIQRGIQLTLRHWLPPHILAAVAMSILLSVHLAQVLLF